MSSQDPLWWKTFLFRTAGALIFIAMVSKPDAFVYASASNALNAWLVRMAWAAGWALLTGMMALRPGDMASLRITPAPSSPYEFEKPLDRSVEERSRIDLRMVVCFALAAFIDSLLTDKATLAAPLGSPQNIAAWVGVFISTAFWGMLGGAFRKKPHGHDDSAAVKQAEEHPPAWLAEPAPKRRIDRVRWIMFALFFSVLFAVSLWANGGSLLLSRTWFGSLEYCGKLLLMSATFALFWAPIPATYSSGDPETLHVTPAR